MAKEELKIVANDPIDLDDKSESTKPDESTKTQDSSEKNPEISSSPDAKVTPSETVMASETQDEEEPPKAPPRPVSPITAMKNNLKEAFPSVDERVITGVLIASRGDLDVSFNALLYISDESVEEPEILPAAESKPVQNVVKPTDDEALARQLQKEFELEERRRRRQQKERQRRQLQEDDESPDEFDQFKETFSQGLEEARTTLNGWVSGLAKNFNGNQNTGQSSQQPKLFGALGGSSAQTQRNKKFDEDPEIISNDFHQKITLDNNDEKGPQLPKRKQTWNDNEVPVNSDAFMVTDSEDEDKKDIKL